MANLEGFRHKFIVFKHEDFDMVTTPSEKNQTVRIGEKIADFRVREGKVPHPKFLVINTDEPYADEIIEILKKNGHWG